MSSETSANQYISTLELAKFLGISPVAVFQRIKKGQIKAVKVGRSYAISLSYVREHFPGFTSPHLVEGECVSIMEAAQILGVSRVTIFKKVKSGEIPARKVGRHYIIARHEIVKEAKSEPEAIAISQQEYFSAPQLADILGVSRITIFKNIKSGLINAKKVGRRYVIAREDAGLTGGAVPSIAPARTHISAPELARRMGISRIAVFKKIKQGIIPAVKVGRSYAIALEDLNESGKE